MANTIEQYAKLHAALVQEKKDLEGRLSAIDKALAGKLTPAKKKAAKKKRTTGKKRKKMSAATIKKMKAAAKKRWAAKKKKSK